MSEPFLQTIGSPVRCLTTGCRRRRLSRSVLETPVNGRRTERGGLQAFCGLSQLESPYAGLKWGLGTRGRCNAGPRSPGWIWCTDRPRSVEPSVHANDPALQPSQGGLEPSTDAVLQAAGRPPRALRVDRIDRVANLRRPPSRRRRPRDTDSDDTARRTAASYGDLAFVPRQALTRAPRRTRDASNDDGADRRKA